MTDMRYVAPVSRSGLSDQLLKLVYAGPLEPQPWKGFLQEVRQRLAGSYACIAFHGASLVPGETVATQDAEHDFSPHDESYLNTYAALDPLPYHDLQPGEQYLLKDLLQRAGKEGERFYKGFLRPAGIDSMVILPIAEPHGMRAWVCVARSGPMSEFSARDLELTGALLPHLSTALELFASLKRVEIERSLYRDAVHSLSIGTLILNRRHEIVSVDEVASRIIASNPPLSIRTSRLHLANRAADTMLKNLINQGLTSNAEHFSRAMRLPNDPHLALLVRRVRSSSLQAGDTSPALAIHISDSRMESSTPESQVMALYGLTYTEAALAIHLAQGHTLVEAAEILGLSEQTTRTYSKQIFAKTGTRRQASLVRLMLTSIVRLAA